ncbi:hypothetical protein J6590_100617 [Homalodisca vitripennis]|nr:hypothetical protein J6590_100617 [Homalodisca vitripennis]
MSYVSWGVEDPPPEMRMDTDIHVLYTYFTSIFKVQRTRCDGDVATQDTNPLQSSNTRTKYAVKNKKI